MKHSKLVLLFIVIFISNNYYSQTIIIKDAWARVSSKGSNSAVYLKIVNNGSQKDALIGAASNAAEVVEIHETYNENNRMGMRAVKFLEIPQKSEVNLKPGGFHIMLINLTKDLRNNDTINLVLKFKFSKDIKLKVPVKDMVNARRH